MPSTVHPQRCSRCGGCSTAWPAATPLGDVLVPWLAGLAAVGAALAWAWQPARRGERGDLLDLDWALLAVAMVVTSPQANLHSLALLTVAGVLATRHALAHEAADGALRLPWAFGAGATLATALTVAVPQAMVPVWLAVEGAWLGVLLWAAGRRSGRPLLRKREVVRVTPRRVVAAILEEAEFRSERPIEDYPEGVHRGNARVQTFAATRHEDGVQDGQALSRPVVGGLAPTEALPRPWSACTTMIGGTSRPATMARRTPGKARSR